MKIFLTGGNGMVGQNLQHALRADNIDYRAPLSQSCNLLNFADVSQQLKQYQPDIVLHLAGRVGGIAANIAHPIEALLDNFDMGRNVVMAAKANNIRYLLNFASSCMYPCDRDDAIAEDALLTGRFEPTNEGYGLAKATIARLCQYISALGQGFHYKTMIPCNLYGAYDKFDPERSHLVPAIIHKIAQAKKHNHDSIEIWGDGEARREFLYAGDLAEAVIKAIKDFENLPPLMNLGIGRDYSINDYYQMTADALGANVSFTHDLTKPVGIKRKLTDITLMRQWGFQPQTPFEIGVAKSYEYYKKMQR